MNRRHEKAVEDRTRRPRAGIYPKLLVFAFGLSIQSWLMQSGCVDIDGGAVEFSWAVRDFDGNAIDCQIARIDTVSLCWRDSAITGTTECTGADSRNFVCEREQAATAFVVPPGERTLWIEVACASTGARADPGSYEVPAPIVRTVTTGTIVTLNSLLIVATKAESSCGDRACTCPP